MSANVRLALLGANNKFLSATTYDGISNVIAAVNDGIDSASQYEVKADSANRLALRAQDGSYLSVIGHSGGRMIVESGVKYDRNFDDWCWFDVVVYSAPNQIALKANNGKYLSLILHSSGGPYVLQAQKNSIDNWSVFTVTTLFE